MKRQWLIDIRHGKGYSQQYVANKCGVTYQMYGCVENGKRRPSTELAKKIADVLNFSWTRFYE